MKEKPYFYGRVSIVPSPNPAGARLVAYLVSVPETPKRISRWDVPHEEMMKHSLFHGDIIRATVDPATGTCTILDKIYLE